MTTHAAAAPTARAPLDLPPGPLAGYRVLDLTDERGVLAGKVLGDLGADVLRIEPPGGHPMRRRGPFAGDVPSPNHSLFWLFTNTSKRG
ncbi:MAG: CoA transferase, partial [Chloroflexi bacterium]|nr:CoA transferase [Chloroflexota bacterium]